MKTYYISVSEVRNRIVQVEANDIDQALEKVSMAYECDKIILNDRDFVDYNIEDVTEETIQAHEGNTMPPYQKITDNYIPDIILKDDSFTLDEVSGCLRIDKQIVDDYVLNSYIKIGLYEEDDLSCYEISEYKIVGETDTEIICEYIC